MMLHRGWLWLSGALLALSLPGCELEDLVDNVNPPDRQELGSSSGGFAGGFTTTTITLIPDAGSGDGGFNGTGAASSSGTGAGGDGTGASGAGGGSPGCGPDGTPCNLDGNLCTQDVCTAGFCMAGPLVLCDPPGPCQNPGTCNPISGACTYTSKPNGGMCNADASLCTQDSCMNGVCMVGPANACSAMSQCHEPGQCDPATGACSTPWKVNGAPCNADNSLCTQSDSCMNGSCVAGPTVSCAIPPGACQNPGTCNPISGACAYPNKPNGTACDDGSTCTPGNDACQDGECTGPTSCPPMTQCHLPVCDVGGGNCTQQALTGTGCDLPGPCSTNDVCEDGICTTGPAVPCPPAAPCMQALACDAVDGCVQEPLADGTGCSDGTVCTTGDTCRAGQCVGAAIPCENKPCIVRACDAALGCIDVSPEFDGVSCQGPDGASGICVAGQCFTDGEATTSSSGVGGNAGTGGAGAAAAGGASAGGAPPVPAVPPAGPFRLHGGGCNVAVAGAPGPAGGAPGPAGALAAGVAALLLAARRRRPTGPAARSSRRSPLPR